MSVCNQGVDLNGPHAGGPTANTVRVTTVELNQGVLPSRIQVEFGFGLGGGRSGEVAAQGVEHELWDWGEGNTGISLPFALFLSGHSRCAF